MNDDERVPIDRIDHIALSANRTLPPTHQTVTVAQVERWRRVARTAREFVDAPGGAIDPLDALCGAVESLRDEDF